MKSTLPIIVMVLLLAALAPATEEKSFTVDYWPTNKNRELQPRKLPLPRDIPSHDLAALPLVLTKPSLLRLGGTTYLLDLEGLYRVRAESSGKVVRQTILYRGDVWRFAGHLSRLYVYGTRHQGEGQAKWDERARQGEPLSLQCGYIAAFVHQHLSARKVPARLVSCATGANWNNFDDGHALMEVFDSVQGRWILFDPTLGARFQHQGRWLNLLEMTQRYRRGERADHLEFLNASSKIDPLMDYDGFYARFVSDKKERLAVVARFKPLLKGEVEGIQRWYGRVMQIPLIGNYFVPGSDAEDALLRTLPSWKNLERLSTAQFQKRFYPEFGN